MAARADAPFSPTETLAAIVQEEIHSCRSILRATEAFEEALNPVDFERLEAAVAARGQELGRLGQLEAQAETLRGQAFAPPAELAGELALLRELTAKVRQADARAREATAGALDSLRRGIRTVARGQYGLKGYRSPSDPTPRFADKRG
jgi:hypothetical protein